MSKKKKSVITTALIVLISFCCGFLVNSFTGLGIIGGTFSLRDLSVLTAVGKIISEYSIQEQESKNVLDYALKGIATSLGDQYAFYLTAEEAEEYNLSKQGMIQGEIGGTLKRYEGKNYFSQVYTGFGAEQAGIKVGDILIAVDETDVQDKSISEISALTVGEPETTVKLTVLRGEKELSFVVKRINGQRQMTEYKLLDNNMLYIKIHSFNGNAAEYFKKAIEFAKEKNVKGLIIDLRGNPGGSIPIFAEIADLLLPEGEFFYGLTRKGQKLNSCVSDAEFYDVPISVIINGNSASASEAMAGALRDMADAELVGTKSYGKGVMQRSYGLSNGGVFKLTIAKYYLPSGDCIDGAGIEPEHKVELKDNLDVETWRLNSENDLQLKKAIEVLTK